MTTISGTMATGRPARYAKQLVSHWAGREVEVTVAEGEDAARFAQVVKEHLERFGARDELDLVWDD